MLELVAAFICLTSLLTYVNFRFIGLPPTIGVMVTALMFSLLLQGLSFLGYPGLEEREWKPDRVGPCLDAKTGTRGTSTGCGKATRSARSLTVVKADGCSA